MNSMSFIIVTLILCIFIHIDESHGQKVTVETSSGRVVGVKEKTVDGIKLSVFRGIPYAQPPVGKRRFRRPVPIKWTDKEIDASKFKEACHQNQTIMYTSLTLINKNMSEDCLYLNIWTPKASPLSLKAVMVWIHGGGLLSGGASEWFLQGEVLSVKGDVVVVTFNYRFVNMHFTYHAWPRGVSQNSPVI